MPLTISRLVEQVDEPLELSDIKAFLNIESTADDDLLHSMRLEVRDYLERVTHRQFMTATLLYALDCFPCQKTMFSIPRPPLQSVTSIQYYDSNNVLTTWPTTEYGVDSLSEPGRIFLLPGHRWPSTYRIPNAIRITYLAGWDSAEAIPARLKSLMLFLIGDFYHYRRGTSIEDFIQEVPYVQTLLRSLRIYEFF